LNDGQRQQLQRFYQVEVDLMSALTGDGGWSQRAALDLLGLSRSTWYYRSSPRARTGTSVPHTARVAGHWLTQAERDAILVRLTAAFADGESVYQGFYEALDAGDPVASLSTWYRLAQAHLAAQRPVRRRRSHPARAIPQLCATRPVQVWSWDITKLPGPYRGVSYDFYVAVDVFSRAIVAWRVEDRECDDLAKEMFAAAFSRCDARPKVVHSDGGAAMTSKTLTELFRDLGIQASRNRPRVSNDNPYSESLFKTAKYRPGYPGWFPAIDDARAWAQRFVTWYNDQHRHSALEGHTPASVHDGSWITVHHARQATLDRLYQQQPNRFPRRPRVKTPLAAATINQPKPEDRLQTG
jgi:transposase InsO family protein